MLNASNVISTDKKATLNVSEACVSVPYRYNNQVQRLKALRDSHPIIGLQDGRYIYELYYLLKVRSIIDRNFQYIFIAIHDLFVGS